MGEYRRLGVLVLIMIGVCLIVGATAIGMIYEEALHRERERLVNITQSQARLMEALARIEAPVLSEGEQQKKALFRRSWKRIGACASRSSARPPSYNSPAKTATSSCM
jgi:hypothetical protein